MKRAPVCAKLEGEIAALAGLPRQDLIDRWQALYGASPPKGLSRRLLILAIAHRMPDCEFARWSLLLHTNGLQAEY
jgi:hypothetical protein